MFTQDFIVNGQIVGPNAAQLSLNRSDQRRIHGGEPRFDPGYSRPFIIETPSGKLERVVQLQTGKQVYNAEKKKWVNEVEIVRIGDLVNDGILHPVWNSISLRKDDWLDMDTVVVRAARNRLRAWSDLAASASKTINGMAKTVLEHETMTDAHEAVVDMDAIAEGRNDYPLVGRQGTPLPITHSDFFYTRRTLEISRNSGDGLDSISAEMAGFRIAEMIEKTTIGIVTGMTYGNASLYTRAPTVYGYLNFPPRLTKTNMTTPTGSNGSAVLTSFLQLRDLLYAAKKYGPYMVYTSTDYDAYLDNLFSTTEPSAGTLRSRLLQIDGIRDIRRLDYLASATNPFTVIMVQMERSTAQAIIGMPITTVQWDTKGGMQKNYKVMTIMVPELRSDADGNTGIAVGTVS